MMTLRSLLVYLFAVHFFILFFQLPLRELVIDVTIWRDIGIIFILLVWLAAMAMESRSALRKPDSLGTAILVFVSYSAVNCLLSTITSTSLLDAVTYFRNHFFAFLLFFPARYAFKHEHYQKKFLRFFSVVLIIYIATPILEILIKLSGISLELLPWYSYTFKHGDRFEGNAEGGYIKTEESPVLGLLGFPHYSVVPMVGLFALMYPFLFAETQTAKQNRATMQVMFMYQLRYFYVIGLICATLILQVRTHIISAFVVLFLFAPAYLRKGKNFAILLGFLLTAALVYMKMSSSGLSVIYDAFGSGFTGSQGRDSSLSLILTASEFLYVFTSPLINLLFGHGATVILATPYDWEIKLLYYTGVYGLVWLILFIIINVIGFRYIRSIQRFFEKGSFEYVLSRGIQVMTVIFLIDAGHYMRMMTWPCLDMWIVSLGILSVLRTKARAAQIKELDAA